MTDREMRYPTNGKVERDGDRYRVTFPRASGKLVVTSDYDFTQHPLRDRLAGFILADTEEFSAGTIRGKCVGAQVLGEFMLQTTAGDLNPEVYSRYLDWLEQAEKPTGEKRFGISSFGEFALCALALYASGIGVAGCTWSQRVLDTMQRRYMRASKGHTKQRQQRSMDLAMSEENFANLARAIALEFAECERVHQEYTAGTRPHLQAPGLGLACLSPNPGVTFALMAATRVGLRASEFNALELADVFRDPVHGHHTLYAHGPNKDDDYLPIDDVMLRILDLCEAWQAEARERASAGGHEWPDGMIVYTSTSSGNAPVVLYTTLLNQVHLPAFFLKYHQMLVDDGTGGMRPLLHAEGDTTQPFYTSYAKLRNAFARRVTDREIDPTTGRRLLRHKSFQTTETYYLHNRRLDHARKTSIALKSEARMLVLGMSQPQLVGISDETIRKAEEAGAMVPGGVCGPALDGNGCVSPGPCIRCKHLIVLSDRAPRIEADRDALISAAAAAEMAGDTRGAENYRGRATRAQAYLYVIEDRRNQRDK